MTTENQASNFAERLLAGLVARGVADIVVAPGSRSQALALAAARLESLGSVRLHVRVDERSAAFLALGIALETGKPAPVIVTSGTAVLNLIPAAAEAHHAAVPLMLLTADRPTALHGVGSSQTTQQAGMMPHLFRYQTDIQVGQDGHAGQDGQISPEAVAEQAFDAAMSPGPVHLNLAFTEPLSGDSGIEDLAALANAATIPARAETRQRHEATHDVTRRETVTRETVTLVADGTTIVIAGHGAGPQAAHVAEALAAPLIAEVTSHAHFGPNLIVGYRHVLNTTALSEHINRVLVFGIPTLSREVPKLIATAPEVILATGDHPELFNPTHRSVTIADRIVIDEAPAHAYAQADAVLHDWLQADRDAAAIADDSLPAPDLELAKNMHFKAQAEFVKQELAIDRTPVTRSALVNAVWQATWPHDRLVLGASQLIRELDQVANGRRVTVYSNRGLAGIDGTISTAIGVAVSKPATEAGITRVLLGDLALLHDIGALFLNPVEEQPRLQIVVGNDGGGKIFDRLEVASSADPKAFDRTIFVAHDQTFEGLAKSFGWNYLHTTSRGELDRMLTMQLTGPTLIEVALDR